MRGILIENFLLLSVVLLITIGQILIKLGVNELSIDKESENFINTVIVAFSSIKVLTGVFLAALAAIAWVLLLTKVELTAVYPYMMLPILLISILSLFLLNESISNIQWLGIAFIVIGYWFFST
jgi:drug/metabolite transporter (DMT)-like permease